MGRWDDAATWEGEGLSREVFYFGPAGSRLYGSLYAAQSPSRPDGVVVCSSWGFEADRSEHLSHYLALATARAGGAGMVFHYPGFGDSHGAYLGDATIDSLAAAAAAAIEEARRRRPRLSWFPAGLMIGAAVACLAQRASGAADRLLFVQPALNPAAYFGKLGESAHGVTLASGEVREMSFAYPFPRRIVEAGARADQAVGDCLRAFEGQGAVIRCARPAREKLVPDRFADVAVEGVWRFATPQTLPLERGIEEWLRA